MVYFPLLSEGPLIEWTPLTVAVLSCQQQSFLWLILYSTFYTWEIPKHLTKPWVNLTLIVMAWADTADGSNPGQLTWLQILGLSRRPVGQATPILSGPPSLSRLERTSSHLLGYSWVTMLSSPTRLQTEEIGPVHSFRLRSSMALWLHEHHCTLSRCPVLCQASAPGEGRCFG